MVDPREWTVPRKQNVALRAQRRCQMNRIRRSELIGAMLYKQSISVLPDIPFKLDPPDPWTLEVFEDMTVFFIGQRGCTVA
jgi:hypothetical protein